MHTQRAWLAAFLLGTAGLLAGNVASAAVIYDEAINGDFSGQLSTPTPVGTLALGTSTVTGRLANNFENGTEDGFDVFSFVLASGTRLSALTLNFDNGLYTNGANIFLRTASGSNLASLNTFISGIVTGGSLLGAPTLDALSPGTYAFALAGVGTSFGLDTYSFNFTVVDATPPAVPEPASGLLVIGSLLALAATRRRAAPQA